MVAYRYDFYDSMNYEGMAWGVGVVRVCGVVWLRFSMLSVAFLHVSGCDTPCGGLRYSMRFSGLVAILHAVGCDTPCGGVCRNACVFEGVWSGLCRMSVGFLGVFARVAWGLRGRVVAFLHAAGCDTPCFVALWDCSEAGGKPPALADNVDYVRKGACPIVGASSFPMPCADSTTGSA